MAQGTTTLEGVFDSFFSTIISSLADMAVQWASSKLFESFMGGGKQSGGLAALLSPTASGVGGEGDTIGSILSTGVSLLGSLGGFDDGGIIPGRYNGRPDQHTARVNPGEFIFNRQAVAFHSPGKLNAMNNMQRFDSGGMVGSDRPMYRDYTDRPEPKGSNEPIKVEYTVTEINSVRYVSEDQFRKGLAATSDQTEKRITCSMRNKPSYRAGIGI